MINFQPVLALKSSRYDDDGDEIMMLVLIYEIANTCGACANSDASGRAEICPVLSDLYHFKAF